MTEKLCSNSPKNIQKQNFKKHGRFWIWFIYILETYGESAKKYTQIPAENMAMFFGVIPRVNFYQNWTFGGNWLTLVLFTN